MFRAAVKSLSMYLLLWPASDAMESPAPDTANIGKRFKVIPWHCVEGGGGGGDGSGGNAMLVMAVVVMRGGMP